MFHYDYSCFGHTRTMIAINILLPPKGHVIFSTSNSSIYTKDLFYFIKDVCCMERIVCRSIFLSILNCIFILRRYFCPILYFFFHCFTLICYTLFCGLPHSTRNPKGHEEKSVSLTQFCHSCSCRLDESAHPHLLSVVYWIHIPLSRSE